MSTMTGQQIDGLVSLRISLVLRLERTRVNLRKAQQSERDLLSQLAAVEAALKVAENGHRKARA